MGRNHLKGREGDRINAVLAAAGYSFSLLRRWFERILRALWLIIGRAILAPLSQALGTFFTADDFLAVRFGSAWRVGPGQPPLPTRLAAGPFILKHMHNLTDRLASRPDSRVCANTLRVTGKMFIVTNALSDVSAAARSAGLPRAGRPTGQRHSSLASLSRWRMAPSR
jgi:hypothetical protein